MVYFCSRNGAQIGAEADFFAQWHPEIDRYY